jgi:hypothetical protein
MNEKTVKGIIQRCVEKLYDKDNYLFDCKICERCLMFRLAYYLQLEFPDYFVDCEFNKMGFNKYKAETKVEPNIQGIALKKMYTDIIIHKRNSNTQNNFICLEIKRTKRAIEYDIKRLKMMTEDSGFVFKNTNYIYAYDFGFLIYLPKDKTNSEISIFKNGIEINIK